jgi:hypothetical protein
MHESERVSDDARDRRTGGVVGLAGVFSARARIVTAKARGELAED